MILIITVRHMLQWTVACGLLAALQGCHFDFWASSGTGPTATPPAARHTVGGTAAGLAPGAVLTLVDNNSDPLSISASGAFTFKAALAEHAGYSVAISAQPTGQDCSVASGTGTMGTANITSVAVTCSNRTFTLGGSIQGLSSAGLVLANGSAVVSVPSGAQSFTFPAAVAYDSAYSVAVRTQPTGLMCTVTAGSGVMPAQAVTTISVKCVVPSFTVGGTITGLGAHTGLVLSNGSDTLSVAANATAFSMPTPVFAGAQYNVSVSTQPAGGNCTVTNGLGTMAAAAVGTVAVACVFVRESVLYSFAGAPSDGAEPWYGSLLFAQDGNLYGMTSSGGAYNGGTVFKISPSGVETVLWSFGNGNDGANPYGSLIQAGDGTFYGMTNLGGQYTRGTVFKITPGGAETVLWSFGNGNDGSNPYGSLIQGSDGNFYGLTYLGGSYQGYVGGVYQSGTVFKITPAGVETVLWSFGNGSDGSMPYGNLVLGNDGKFYGMTYAGGVNGMGTVFNISPAGTETLLWSFGTGSDGAHPTGSVTLGNDGNFYGMTINGGTNGMGAAFKIAPGGTETLLYSFANTGDGYQPQGSLIQGTDGNFYGVAGIGGGAGWGALVELTPSGGESVVYSFGPLSTGSVTDGQSPFGALIQGSDGTFYGMTSRGGAHDLGTVFTFK